MFTTSPILTSPRPALFCVFATVEKKRQRFHGGAFFNLIFAAFLRVKIIFWNGTPVA
jgi:hypothetical protein